MADPILVLGYLLGGPTVSNPDGDLPATVSGGLPVAGPADTSSAHCPPRYRALHFHLR
jgi:hypothetical protein